jgi:hypothetical protein
MNGENRHQTNHDEEFEDAIGGGGVFFTGDRRFPKTFSTLRFDSIGTIRSRQTDSRSAVRAGHAAVADLGNSSGSLPPLTTSPRLAVRQSRNSSIKQ